MQGSTHIREVALRCFSLLCCTQSLNAAIIPLYLIVDPWSYPRGAVRECPGPLKKFQSIFRTHFWTSGTKKHLESLFRSKMVYIKTRIINITYSCNGKKINNYPPQKSENGTEKHEKLEKTIVPLPRSPKMVQRTGSITFKTQQSPDAHTAVYTFR
jgi:hypothetical protein